MWNTVFHEHQQQSPNCRGFLSWELGKEQQWGWAWRDVAVCSNCRYTSECFNMYEAADTEERGKKAAKINIGLQVGLTHTPTSTTIFQNLCLSCSNHCHATHGKQGG